MAEKYNVGLPLGTEETNSDAINKFISPKHAGLIPRSVRLEITQKGKLLDAPSKDLVEACLLLADISGFTALGEKLTKEHGDARGAEEFASQMSAAISALVNVAHRYEGEVVKIAGDCLICTFPAIPTDPEDEGDTASFQRGKECALEMLNIIKQTNENLDLHGGLAGSAPLQRIHLKELRGSSPRSNSARQRMKKVEQSTMSRAEYERSKQRWFLIAGRPIKIAAGLLDKAKAGTIKVYGGLNLTRETKYADIADEEEVLALKFNFQLEEDDINALGIILPTLAKRDETGTQLEHGRLEARAAQVCLKIFQSLENTIFVFEDAHWIDSQSWIMLQMVLPQLSTRSIVMIVTRPPNMISQQKDGGADELLKANEEKLEDEWLEDDDRIKFSRILASLKENSTITYLELGTMGQNAMQELIAKTLEVETASVSEEFVKLMDQKAGGIPMYLSSMTNWLKERNLVQKDDGGNIKFDGDINSIKFPNSIMDTVHERIDSLDEEAKVLIKVCSCFGFEFRQENLQNVAPQFLSSKDASQLQVTLETLAARGLVVAVTGESVSKMMKFTHQIITEYA